MSSLGSLGESKAAQYLRSRGCKILFTNLRFGHGELDIVALDDDCLVFCEVKTRLNREFGEPFESVTEAKQSQLRFLAEMFLSVVDMPDKAYADIRFDVISIVMNGLTIDCLEHIEDAF